MNSERNWNWGWWRNDRSERPHIDDIDPASGAAGTEVTLTGEHFSDESSVKFGKTMIDDIEMSDDGTELTFEVPDVDEDMYRVRVHDDRWSNTVRFEVTEPTNEPDDLSITDIEGPTSLSVDEEGTWTVEVEGEAEGNLSYSVVWGDEPNMFMRLFSDEDEKTQQSATFTHTYTDEGTFTPEFTVTDEDGNTVTKASASVTVSEDDDGDEVPHLGSIDPSEAEAGATITLTGSGFDADSMVYLSGTEADEVVVDSDNEITFTVPATLDTGAYRVIVRDDDGRSNALRLDVIEEVDTGHVSVNGVSAPTQLAVGEEGTWTVHANSSLDGNLRYSVVWGDEDQYMSRMSLSADTQSSATFTHTYGEAGDYSPKFTVTNEHGESASVQASVTVSEED